MNVLQIRVNHCKNVESTTTEQTHECVLVF